MHKYDIPDVISFTVFCICAEKSINGHEHAVVIYGIVVFVVEQSFNIPDLKSVVYEVAEFEVMGFDLHRST